MLTTNQRGLAAETRIVHECVLLGIGVARPLDDERYDLIFDLRPRLLRVQCKWARRHGAVILVRCRRCRRGPEGFIHRGYGSDEIDAIAAFCLDTGTCYLLPRELSFDRASFSCVLSRAATTNSWGFTGLAISSLGLHWIGCEGP